MREGLKEIVRLESLHKSLLTQETKQRLKTEFSKMKLVKAMQSTKKIMYARQ